MGNTKRTKMQIGGNSYQNAKIHELQKFLTKMENWCTNQSREIAELTAVNKKYKT